MQVLSTYSLHTTMSSDSSPVMKSPITIQTLQQVLSLKQPFAIQRHTLQVKDIEKSPSDTLPMTIPSLVKLSLHTLPVAIPLHQSISTESTCTNGAGILRTKHRDMKLVHRNFQNTLFPYFSRNMDVMSLIHVSSPKFKPSTVLQ